MLNEAIILAGGLGTRLRPVVADVPKPLAPVAGRPFLCWLLDGLARQGVKSVVLATGYKGDVILDALGTQYSGISLTHLQEKKILGTGGALWAALRACRSERVFVLNGDTWLGMDLSKLSAAAPKADITLAALYMEECSRYGGLLLDGDRMLGLQTQEAAQKDFTAVNAGVYVVRTDLPARFAMPETFSLEAEVFGRAACYDIRAYVSNAVFLDIGTPEDYALAQTLIPEWAAQ